LLSNEHAAEQLRGPIVVSANERCLPNI
jgi:hypothetical protein